MITIKDDGNEDGATADPKEEVFIHLHKRFISIYIVTIGLQLYQKWVGLKHGELNYDSSLAPANQPNYIRVNHEDKKINLKDVQRWIWTNGFKSKTHHYELFRLFCDSSFPYPHFPIL